MNNRILTIGILAYNRGEYVKRNLDAIINQLADFDPKEIEILISDNASTDNTEKVVGSYKEKYPALITYFRNDRNVGFDNNVDLVVQRAGGKYVWLLGCEDIPKQGSIREILKEVSTDTYENILLNFETYSEKKGETDCSNVFNITKDEIFYSLKDLLGKTNGPSAAISSNIVLRDSWLKVMNRPLFVTGWCHVERIFDILALSDYKRTLRISFVCFTLSRGENEWWATSLVFFNFMSYVKIFKNLSNRGFPKKMADHLVFKHSYLHFFRSIIKAKQVGLGFNTGIIFDSIRLFSKYPLSYIIGIPLMLLPRNLFSMKIFLTVLRKIKELYHNAISIRRHK